MTLNSSSLTLSDQGSGSGPMPCILMSEALAAFNDHLRDRYEKPWGMRLFEERIRTHVKSGTVTGNLSHAAELVSVTRWPGIGIAISGYLPGARGKPVPSRAELLHGQRFAGASGDRTYPGPHEEFIIDLGALREAAAQAAEPGDDDDERWWVSEGDIYAATWSCLAVLSHPPGWYPPPYSSAKDNMLAVCERAAGMLIGELRGQAQASDADPGLTVRAWLAETVVPDQDGTPAGQLYQLYEAWCTARQHAPANVTAWGRVLTEAGYPPVRGRDGKRRMLKPRA
jgi:hypothetical protein